MSYCNKGRDGSDVTARYDAETKTFICEECALHPMGIGPMTSEAPQALRAHFDQHIAAGHHIPEYALQTIDADIAHWAPGVELGIGGEVEE